MCTYLYLPSICVYIYIYETRSICVYIYNYLYMCIYLYLPETWRQVYEGFWFSPEMEYLQNAMDFSQRYTRGHFTEMCSGSEEGSYLRPIDFCITQL